MLWIKRRSLWGDYGNILFHGDAYVSSERESAPIGSTVLNLCIPHEAVMLPKGFFLCCRKVYDRFHEAGIQLVAVPVWVEHAAEVPIHKWLKRGEPSYPKGGEPEGYFSQYEMASNFEVGFSSNILHIQPDACVQIEIPSFGATPEITGSLPPGCNLVIGKKTEHSLRGPHFCSESLGEVLRSLNCDNFELVPVNNKN